MSALGSYVARCASSPPLIFYEPELPTGFPDAVAVFCHARFSDPRPSRQKLGNDHLRLLHHLYRVRRGSAMELALALDHTERHVRRVLDDLEHADLVRQYRDRAVARSLDSVFVATRIVTVEAKIRDWRKALRQAIANTWFASHSYVLMPANRLSRTIFRQAARFGIGVMSYDGTRVAVRLRARRLAIPSSYGSWLVNEWAVRRTSHAH